MSDLPEIRARAARRLISWRFCHSLPGMGVLKLLRALISRQGGGARGAGGAPPPPPPAGPPPRRPLPPAARRGLPPPPLLSSLLSWGARRAWPLVGGRPRA